MYNVGLGVGNAIIVMAEGFFLVVPLWVERKSISQRWNVYTDEIHFGWESSEFHIWKLYLTAIPILGMKMQRWIIEKEVANQNQPTNVSCTMPPETWIERVILNQHNQQANEMVLKQLH